MDCFLKDKLNQQWPKAKNYFFVKIEFFIIDFNK
ncbi:hypothetical protein HDEF_2090 [Candidatus Hamiltonella defensa 5AT (Acyrthosiphon pisum)]|uniref:Uncharacterized protein n=1 Tax=Hamiltonella defensa subsp. Acyrthosiphon pisum (strain 5AT) TaxID=572265 RepID=C4K7W3_HAMD5|nr:hypothetical protein HDEF_2090 [Candidatus Hamiltonella defensa 5AT (Acyrthosiphon pisum)]